MDIGKLTYLLVQGFIIGAGPCLLSCAPILLPYIAGTKKTWQEGLKATLVFGFSRLVVYTLLGGMVGYIGAFLFQLFYSRIWAKILWSIAGLFIVALGILMILGKEIKNPLCQYLQKQTLEDSTKSMILLGILVGLSPCLPLIAVLTEIMFISEWFYEGFLYGLAFGVGTVISPLLLLGAAAPLFKKPRLLEVICGVTLVLFGACLIISRLQQN